MLRSVAADADVVRLSSEHGVGITE
jgi:hypothetical protein